MKRLLGGAVFAVAAILGTLTRWAAVEAKD
jgi:hypothetical protein